MKCWACAVDDFTDFTSTYFSHTKSKMVEFVNSFIKELNGLDIKVQYLRYNNAGKHIGRLQELCADNEITMEFTATNTPQQNGRVEKKIHTIWQRAMVSMVLANMNKESKLHFWAEAVAMSDLLENLTLKNCRTTPALEAWAGKKVKKRIGKLIDFERLGVMNKK